MLAAYTIRSMEDQWRALREILQQIALLGLWRSKFLEKAAFYGGTALRILYGIDRFSEDLDFPLLAPTKGFDVSGYSDALQKELAAFGFKVRIEPVRKAAAGPVQSTFLKADTLNQLLVIQTPEEMVKRAYRGQVLKIKLDMDTNPPPGFETHPRLVLQPIPFAVRTYGLSDLFAGKMHAILCRRWKRRFKGRDWYDLIWYAANHPELHLAHLEQRMRQSGDWKGDTSLDRASLQKRMKEAIDALDVNQARREVAPFVRYPQALDVWSKGFFRDVAGRIRIV